MNNLLRFATVTLASAALVATSTSGATAQTDHSSAASASEPARQAPYSLSSTSDASFTTQGIAAFRFNDGVLARKSDNFVKGSVAISLAKAPDSVTTQVTVNGKPRGSVHVMRPDGSYITNGILLPAAIGPGQVVLGPTTIKYADGTAEVSPTKSNAFYFRRDTFGSLKIRHQGKKVTVKAQARWRANDGTTITAKRASLQYKKGSKWKTIKTLKLNSKGKATYKYKTRSKRTYRLVVRKSSTSQGMTVKLRRKI